MPSRPSQGRRQRCPLGEPQLVAVTGRQRATGEAVAFEANQKIGDLARRPIPRKGDIPHRRSIEYDRRTARFPKAARVIDHLSYLRRALCRNRARRLLGRSDGRPRAATLPFHTPPSYHPHRRVGTPGAAISSPAARHPPHRGAPLSCRTGKEKARQPEEGSAPGKVDVAHEPRAAVTVANRTFPDRGRRATIEIGPPREGSALVACLRSLGRHVVVCCVPLRPDFEPPQSLRAA